MANKLKPSGWVGWVYFAGAMLLALGGIQIIAGLAAILRDNFYAVTSSGLVAFNYATWGWIHLFLGILAMASAVGLWAGSTWARVVVVVLVVLIMIDDVAFLTAYPLWSLIGLVISGFIIYAVTLHGGELGS